MAVKKLCLIEKDENLIGSLRASFGKHGVEVNVSEGGLQVLSHVREYMPDAVLLRIELAKDSEGWTHCNNLKKDLTTRLIPLIVMTSKANADTIEKHKALRSRAEEYIRLPANPSEIISAVGRAAGDEDLVIHTGNGNGTEPEPDPFAGMDSGGASSGAASAGDDGGLDIPLETHDGEDLSRPRSQGADVDFSSGADDEDMHVDIDDLDEEEETAAVTGKFSVGSGESDVLVSKAVEAEPDERSRPDSIAAFDLSVEAESGDEFVLGEEHLAPDQDPVVEITHQKPPAPQPISAMMNIEAALRPATQSRVMTANVANPAQTPGAHREVSKLLRENRASLERIAELESEIVELRMARDLLDNMQMENKRLASQVMDIRGQLERERSRVRELESGVAPAAGGSGSGELAALKARAAALEEKNSKNEERLVRAYQRIKQDMKVRSRAVLMLEGALAALKEGLPEPGNEGERPDPTDFGDVLS